MMETWLLEIVANGVSYASRDHELFSVFSCKLSHKPQFFWKLSKICCPFLRVFFEYRRKEKIQILRLWSVIDENWAELLDSIFDFKIQMT